MLRDQYLEIDNRFPISRDLSQGPGRADFRGWAKVRFSIHQKIGALGFLIPYVLAFVAFASKKKPFGHHSTSNGPLPREISLRRASRVLDRRAQERDSS